SAAGALGIDLARSWLIGDAPRDIEAGRRAGLRTILFHDPALPPSPAASETPAAEPERTVHSLREAIDYIEASTAKSPPPGPDTQPAPMSVASMTSPPPAAAAPTPAAPHPAQPPSSESAPPLRTLEQTAHLILQELRHRSAPSSDFSVSRLMAGITQVLAIATLFFAYLNRGNATLVQHILLLALVL